MIDKIKKELKSKVYLKYVIKVADREEQIKIQKFLFDNGFKWGRSGISLIFNDMTYILIFSLAKLSKRYYYINYQDEKRFIKHKPYKYKFITFKDLTYQMNTNKFIDNLFKDIL